MDKRTIPGCGRRKPSDIDGTLLDSVDFRAMA